MPLSRLSPDEVDFIMKAKEVQYSNCEIAQRLGVTEGAIRYRIKRREQSTGLRLNSILCQTNSFAIQRTSSVSMRPSNLQERYSSSPGS